MSPGQASAFPGSRAAALTAKPESASASAEPSSTPASGLAVGIGGSRGGGGAEAVGGGPALGSTAGPAAAPEQGAAPMGVAITRRTTARSLRGSVERVRIPRSVRCRQAPRKRHLGLRRCIRAAAEAYLVPKIGLIVERHGGPAAVADGAPPAALEA